MSIVVNRPTHVKRVRGNLGALTTLEYCDHGGRTAN
jgi:hypothetical protein